MNKILEGSLLVAILVIFYLVWELLHQKKRISELQKRVKSLDKHSLFESAPLSSNPTPAPSDGLEAHDKIIKMFESGMTIESICETLKIPQSKVEMTLKFEKMKKNGS